MATTIDSLQVEIQASASSAVNGVDLLASSLERLKNAVKGGVGLTAVSKQLTTLNTALNSVSGTNADNLNRLAQGLQTLSTCGNLKLSSSVASQITNLGTAVRSLAGADFSLLTSLGSSLAPLENLGRANLNSFISQLQRLPQALQALSSANIQNVGTQIRQLVSALAPLSQMGRNNLTSFLTQLQRLPQVMAGLQSVNMSALTAQIQQLANALAPLAAQMQSIANGFSAFPARIQRLISSTNNLSAANNSAATGYANLAAKIGLAYASMKKMGRVIGSWIVKSNEYVEDLNLFTASMGQYANEAKAYAEQVADVMGIDPAEWMRNQGIFMTITSGFGVASDRAHTMSQNLTQLGYDISSLYNIPYADSMQKLQSGIAGELEPLRRLGYDLSVARLQQEAYTLGIKKKVSAMNQAEKADLRYYAVMTQVTTAQGDMARTLNAPANQIRILKAQLSQCARELGNIFIHALKAVLPYLIAFANVVRIVANAIANLFGFELPDIDYSGLTGAAGGAEDVAGALDGANSSAKKLKENLLGIDELNIISPQTDTDTGSGSSGTGGGLGFELPTYDFLGDAVNDEVQKIIASMKEWLGITDGINSWSELFDSRLGMILLTVGEIGIAFAAWKVSKLLAPLFKSLKGLKGANLFYEIGFKIAGLGFFLDAWQTIKEAVQDIAANDINLTNGTKLLSGFAEGVGAAFIVLGKTQTGGAMLVIAGISGIISSISDMVNNKEINWDNALSLVKNIGLLLAGFGLMTKKFTLGGIGMIIEGITMVLENFNALVKGFTTGDWSEVEWIEVAGGALLLVGGLAFVLKGVVDKINNSKSDGAKDAFDTMTTATEGASTSVGQLSTKLTSLAKNLGMGIIIIAEVAIAAGLIVAAIWGLGLLLEQVGIAWQPVIDNGSTVAIAMGIGVGLLVVIGAVTAGLGSVGTPLIVNMGLGTAILAELGIATGLFILEIWAIGEGLTKIGEAWQPVLDNGETIATGIGLGTALLVGIGVVTAALGAATVATAGLLPVAIALGTALLVEMTASVILFIESLVAVAKELDDNLAPALDDLNETLPTLTTNMSDFVDFMTSFAAEVVRYTEASTISGLSATIDTIVGWFTQDPIDKMSADVEKIAGQAKTLNEKLNVAVPELTTATTLLKDYVGFIDELGTVAGKDGTVQLSEGLKTNLKTVGEGIVTGFNDGVKEKYTTIETTITDWGKDVHKWFTDSFYGNVNKAKFETYATDIINGFKDKVSSYYGQSKSSITTWASDVKTWFTDKVYGAVNKDTFDIYAKGVVSGFNDGITYWSANIISPMGTWATAVKTAFTNVVAYLPFYSIGKDVITGFNDGINDYYKTTLPFMKKWADEAKKEFKKALDSNSPSKVFERIAGDTVLGYNIGIVNMGETTKDVVDSWAGSFMSVSPVMRFAVDTSALKYYNSDSFAKSVSADVTSSSAVAVTGFKEDMGEFYQEYVEPVLLQMAEDMRRQADKNEQTVVQVGNRVVSEAVTTQQRANGFAFAK